MNPITTTVVRLDGIANLVAGIGLAVLAAPAADALALEATWPLFVAAAGFAVFGIEHLVVAARGAGEMVSRLATIDVLFAAVVLAIAIANPTGAGTGARWVLAMLADLAVTVGAVKYWLQRKGARVAVGAA